MENGKPTLDRPVLVEGKYDKIKLESLFSGCILTTDGFSVFHAGERLAFIRRMAAARGLIVLTDSDGGGRQIRAFLRGALPPEQIVNLYIPKIAGKEKRKDKPSRSGMLGVEGMDTDTLRRILTPYICGADAPVSAPRLDKARLYADGYSGTGNAVARRERLLEALGLPPDLPANALVEAVNALGGIPVYEAAAASLTEHSTEAEINCKFDEKSVNDS